MERSETVYAGPDQVTAEAGDGPAEEGQTQRHDRYPENAKEPDGTSRGLRSGAQ